MDASDSPQKQIGHVTTVEFDIRDIHYYICVSFSSSFMLTFRS